MKSFISIIIILFALLLNTQIDFLLCSNKLMYIAIPLMMLIIVIDINVHELQYDKVTVYVILLAFIILIFKWAIGQNYLNRVLNLLITPMLVSICFENLTKKNLILLFRLIIIFYICECGLSIIEWTLNRNLFVFDNLLLLEILSGFEKHEGIFRSTSLLGHPLTNGQVVAVFMAFIAVSDFKKKGVQIILFCLGYISLFCFSTRGAIIVTTIFTIPYFAWKINKCAQQIGRAHV